jgi:hypothetical protein
MNNHNYPVIISMLNPNTLNLSQLKHKLNKTDERTVKKWLEERGIRTKKDGRDTVVFEWNVDFAIQLEIAQELKEAHPFIWHKIYEAGASDVTFVKAVFEAFPPEIKSRKPIKKTNSKRLIN